MKKSILLLSICLAAQVALSQGRFGGGDGRGYARAEVRDTLQCAYTTGLFTYAGCAGVVVNGQAYDSTGSYQQVLTNAAGCDSVLVLQLTLATVDASVTTGTGTITANGPGTYQWLDCDNGLAPIVGATQQAFSPPATGNYAVAVTLNSCTDTSACTNVLVTGVGEAFAGLWSVSPNPTRGDVVLRCDQPVAGSVARLRDGLGRELKAWPLGNAAASRLSLDLPAGLYFLDVAAPSGERAVFRILVR